MIPGDKNFWHCWQLIVGLVETSSCSPTVQNTYQGNLYWFLSSSPSHSYFKINPLLLSLSQEHEIPLASRLFRSSLSAGNHAQCFPYIKYSSEKGGRGELAEQIAMVFNCVSHSRLRMHQINSNRETIVSNLPFINNKMRSEWCTKSLNTMWRFLQNTFLSGNGLVYASNKKGETEKQLLIHKGNGLILWSDQHITISFW